MNICGRCGRANDPEALFCQDCGEPQDSGESLPQEGDLVCPACAKPNPRSTSFCRMCGVRLSDWDPFSGEEKTIKTPCSVCGKNTPHGFAFCQFCGSRISLPGLGENGNVEPTPPAGLPRPITARMDFVNPPPEWDEKEENKDRDYSTPDGNSMNPRFSSLQGEQITHKPEEKPGESPFDSIQKAPMLIHSNGEEYAIHDLPFDLGRTRGQVRFPEDLYLSERHARIVVDENGLVLTDLGSVNGIYLRIKNKSRLKDKSVFCLGSRVLVFERLLEKDCRLEPVKEDGVLVWGSPIENVWGRLRMLTVAGVFRGVHYLSNERVVLGRMSGHICFPDDPDIGASHIALERTADGAVLENLGPDRETFIKLEGPHLLKGGDVFRIGQQVFRFEPADY